jgi:hypothetical protein
MTEEEKRVLDRVLTPTEGLVLQVLAARYRLGERLYTFDSRVHAAINRLGERGLAIEVGSGVIEHTKRAMLSDKGKEYMLLDDYIPPFIERHPELVDAWMELQ